MWSFSVRQCKPGNIIGSKYIRAWAESADNYIRPNISNDDLSREGAVVHFTVCYGGYRRFVHGKAILPLTRVKQKPQDKTNQA